MTNAMVEEMVPTPTSTRLELEDLEPGGVRPMSRAEYNELGKLGVYDDERVELLRGLVVKMSPQGSTHARVITWLTRFLVEHLGPSFDVRPGLPIAAADDSEPEPDFAIVRSDPDARDHPTTALLLIEVSNTSLRTDRRVKLPIYAEAGVPAYWIVDVSRPGALTVEVHTEPSPTGYARSVTLHDGDTLRPSQLPFLLEVAALPR